MVRALLWKEWREQAAILVALVALGAGVLAAATAFGSAPAAVDPFSFAGYQDPPRLAAVMLALTAGTIVGGALFAGERESGTFDYLDTLPPPRRTVWFGKLVAGAVLALGASGSVLAAAAAVGALGDARHAPAWFGWVLALALAFFAWGAFGSTLMKSTLAACGVGLTASLPFVGVSTLIGELGAAALGVGGFGSRRNEAVALPAAVFLLGVCGLVLSLVAYTRPDRLRREVVVAPGVAGTVTVVRRRAARRRSGFGLRSLLWLSFWQLLTPGLVLLGLAVIGGLALAFTYPAYAVWPGLSLSLAALCGVLTWGDERAGAAKFWGERRLPVSRLWLAKVTAGGALTFALVIVLALPNLIVNIVDRTGHVGGFFRAGFLGGTYEWRMNSYVDPRNLFQFALIWPVYGFAAGHLAGMLFKKAVVGIGVAVLAAGGLSALWLPSFVVGGVKEWQLLGPPVLALGLAWWLARAWTTDRLGGRRAIAALAITGGLGAAAVAYSLLYRVEEVEIVPESDDDIRFAKTLPSIEENQGGRETKQALLALAANAPLMNRRPDEALFAEDSARGRVAGLAPLYSTYLFPLVMRNGYPADRPDFDRWLDDAFAGGWDKFVLSAEGKPPGPVDDPTTEAVSGIVLQHEPAQTMAPLLLARGLREQARGNPAGFPRDLAAALAVGRNLRFKTTFFPYGYGMRYDTYCGEATARFLERHAGPPEVLAQVAAVWAKHRALMAGIADETWPASRAAMRSAAQNPSLWTTEYLRIAHERFTRGRGDSREAAKNEAELVGFSYAVPWEKERLRRVVGVGNNPSRASRDRCEDLTRGGVLGFASHTFATRDTGRPVADAAAAELSVAVRRFMAGNGGVAPKALGELVPKYLAAVPADPYDGQSFRYRVSVGETVFLERVERQDRPFFELPFDPFPDQPDRAMTAHAAIGGGLVRAGRPVLGPPGVGPDDSPIAPGEEDLDAVAAVAGGLTQWPFRPLTKEALALDGRDPIWQDGPAGAFRREPVPEPETRRTATVKPGQPVLWSVGPDTIDDGGKERAAAGTGFRSGDVDLVYVVPLPPSPKETK